MPVKQSSSELSMVALENYRKEVTASKKDAQAFLTRVGVITKAGNLKQNYKGKGKELSYRYPKK